MELVRTAKKSRIRVAKTVILILITAVSFILGISAYLTYYGVRCEDKLKIDEYYITTKRENGNTEYYIGNEFDALNKNDHAKININIPSTIGPRFQNPVLCFNVYNCAIKVTIDKHVIYVDGWKDNRRNIPDKFLGNRSYTIPLITKEYDASGKTVTVELYSVSAKSVSTFDSLIVRAEEAWKLPIDGDQALFALLLTIVVISATLTVGSIIRSVMNRTFDIGVPIFMTTFFFALWSMSTERMLSILLRDVKVCSRMEYYAMFFLSLSIAILALQYFRKGIFHKLWIGLTVIDVAYIAGAITVNSISTVYSMQTFIRGLLVVVAAELAVFVTGVNIDKSKRGPVSTVIMRAGCLIMLIMGLLEIGRYQLVFLPNADAIADFKIGTFAAIILGVFMILYYIILNMEAHTSTVEREQLEEIAYNDMLTGIPNRSYFNKTVHEMSEEGLGDYTLIFIDLNDLKKVNDEHGHSCGDELIIAASVCVSKAFSKDGEICRWGGDEFVAFVPGDEAKGKDCISRFENALDEYNDSGLLPFRITAAHGAIFSSKEDPVDLTTALREADMKMYDAKKKMKERRID
ncbi:MAG: diguanylate cyclase [Saccharofermentans sp.]|nr:diguanylate cyclase [Saccharofermentans sp.]